MLNTILSACLFFGVVTTQLVAAQTTNDLESIQREIKDKQSQLDSKVKTAQSLQQQLKTAELEIGELTKASIISAQELKLVKEEQKQLNATHNELSQQKEQQHTLLASQIRSAFMAGDHDYTKLLLNQDNAGKFERILVYYQYLNDARKAQIDKFSGLLKELQEVAQSLAIKQNRILELQESQKQQQIAIQRQQHSRELALNALRSNIDSDAAQIEELQINEQQLADAIARALEQARAKQEMVLNGLANAKGRLLKPVNGNYRRLFGKRRQGQVRWKGVIFDSPEGRPVSAIHQGKVLYADWLKGLGLVTVIDHGEGFMSLYGHNQALLRQVGDVVEAGETIALVGQSGGQSSAGLYFELRHKGKAINPGRWLDI